MKTTDSGISYRSPEQIMMEYVHLSNTIGKMATVSEMEQFRPFVNHECFLYMIQTQLEFMITEATKEANQTARKENKNA